MMPTPRKSLLYSLALATAVLVSACGGGSAGAPDIFPPRVESITSSASGTATGPVTFTITFSEDVGTSFTVDDLTVSGGTAGTLTRLSATQYTLVVSPPAAAAGMITVTFSGTVTDRAGNVSTVNPTIAVAFNTVPPGASGNTGTCTGSCIDFASASVKYAPFEGLVSAGQADDPSDATNKVARFVKGPAGQPWAGATIYTIDATQSVPAFDLSGSKVVTLRVYAPAAGIPIMLKLEDASNGAIFMEKTVSTTQANAWETLSFDFASPTNGTYNAANTYDRVSIFPNFLVAETTNATYYFDELKYTAVAAGGPIVFASGFKSDYPTPRTVEDGEWGFYSGNFTDYLFTFAGGCFTDGGGDCGAPLPAADTFVYLGVGTSAPTTDGFMGIYTMAPGYTAAAPNAGVTLSGQTTMKIKLGWTSEFFAQGSNNELLVRTIGAQEYSNGSGGFCRILLEKLVAPTTAALTEYTITLSSMTLAQACNGGGFTSGVTTVAEALTKAIGEVHVQAIYPRVNTTQPPGGPYPTGFSRGSIVFE